ncbi:MAG: aromatic amino acid ammonia-lyase [Planctomycetota bacterium]|nr:aromatic amino acid ammonia-lyase [Planctomycetota bacterium]
MVKAADDAKAFIAIGDDPLSIEDIVGLATGALRPSLGSSARDRMKRSADIMSRIHARGDDIYGVTTSVGGSLDTQVPMDRSADLSLNILRMHGIGMGRILDDVEAAAVVAARLSSLAGGLSGVRPEVAERLVELLDARLLPRIPSEGSVGASGDLTQLSYLAALLVGEREAHFRGAEVDAADGLDELGLAPLTLLPKEGLALMNGTSATTALACLSWHRALRLARLASTVTALASVAIDGNPIHFDDRIHAAKPHPGQRLVAKWIRDDLAGVARTEQPERLQDRYSVRCAPQIIGVLVDALLWSKTILETELNGVSDNPIVDPDAEVVLHGGNFYGGHVGFACDSLKIAVANVACLLDRQLMLLCHPSESGGLPRDLVGVEGPDACAHNGFKAASITASSMTAEAMKLTMPASAFSRSTELHNQDKVPMATTSARDLIRILELSEQVAGIGVLASCQAHDLRGVVGAGPLTDFHDSVRTAVPKLVQDRRMDIDLATVIELLRADELALGDSDLS